MPFTDDVRDSRLTQHWSGEIDAETAYQPYESAVAVFDEPGITAVVVDLGEVAFVDSTALGSLVRIQRLAADNGASFALRRVPPRVRTLLSITGLDQSITIE